MKTTTSRVFARSAAVGCAAALVGAIAIPLSASADETPAVPKNVIVLISDGAGYNQFDSASLFEAGQSKNQVTVDPATGAITHEPSVDTQVYESWPVQVGQANYSANGRGTYVTENAWSDNTAIGEVVFDLLGHAAPTDENAVGVQATVGAPTASGSLSLSIDANSKVVVLAGASDTLTGTLPEVTVNDTRSEVQAQGNGWTVSGSASEFVAGNRKIGADSLTWAPAIVSSENGASAGGEATLASPASLADSSRTSRVGTTVVAAALTLAVPDEAKSGVYGSEITLSLFAKD